MTRIWDKFLTETDREHVARRPRTAVPLGRRPALLLVDNYHNVLGDEPRPLLEAIEEWPSSTGLAGWEAVAAIQRLLKAVRADQLPVIHATQLSEEESGLPNWSFLRTAGGWSHAGGARGWTAMRRRPQEQRERLQAMDPIARDRYERRYQIVEELAPAPGEVLLKKSGPSAFWCTPLAAHLSALEVDTLIVTGESTSGCVRASVVDAASHRLPTVVVEDCVYDRHEAPHAINLFDMHRKYAEVMSLEDTLAYLAGLRSAGDPAEADSDDRKEVGGSGRGSGRNPDPEG